MPAYILARITVTDEAAFAGYRALVAPVVAAHGGRYLVRGGAVEVKEGPAPPDRLVVIEFPSMDAARTFYGSPEYAPGLRLRDSSAVSELVLVEGVTPS